MIDATGEDLIMEKTATQWMIEPLRKYAQFGGRARRAEYWWFLLLNIGVNMVLGIVDLVIFGLDRGDFGGIGPFGGLATLALLVPGLAVSFRRMHDVDRSAWWLLIGLIPLIGSLVLIYWFCQRGTVGPNQFGDDPIGYGN